MIVLVTGDRDWIDYAFVYDVMRELQRMFRDKLEVAQGLARGADTLTAVACVNLGIKLLGPDEVEVPDPTKPRVTTIKLRGWGAKWEAEGRAAGPIRNATMIKESKAQLVLAFHDRIDQSKGTRDMLNQAGKKRVPAVLLSNRRTATGWDQGPLSAAVPGGILVMLSKATSPLHTTTPPPNAKPRKAITVEAPRVAVTADGTRGMRRGVS